MNVIKLLGNHVALDANGSIVPNTEGLGAEYVLLQHNHASGNAHEVILETSAGAPIGSFFLSPHRPIIIKKDRTDKVFAPGATDIFATSVVHMG